MITVEHKTPEHFKLKNKSLPASPDKDSVMDTPKPLKDSLVHVHHSGPKSAATSKTNSLYGSNDGNINNLDSRLSDTGSSAEQDPSDFDGLIYKDTTNAGNILSMLNVLRKNRQLCDLILQLDDDSQDIYCHQLILACNSKFFMEIFNNYEAETNNQKASAQDVPSSDENTNQKNGHLAAEIPKTTRSSLTDFVNTNHGAKNNRQVLFCLSSYLRHFLSDSQHHYAKINSIIHHNNHQYQHGHANNHNIDMTQAATHDEETINHINQNLDYQALKICIDYMYTGRLKVPSHLLPHVYTLAYHLSIENIVQVCAQYLTRLLNVDNCLSIRSFALDENLIEASSECIEKNIEYILQLKPASISRVNSVSSSMSSLVSNSYTKINEKYQDNMDIAKSCSTLSSSLNLAHKEFNQLPRIQIELVGLKNHKLRLPDGIDTLTELCMNWLVNEVVQESSVTDKKTHDLPELCENLIMLYFSNDSTLHDCCKMEPSDSNFDDNIDDYQKRNNHLGIKDGHPNVHKKRKSKKASAILNTPSPASSCNRLKTFTITDQELNNIGTATPIKLKVLHDNEVICAQQTSDSSFIAICTLAGNLVTLSVHLLKRKKQAISSENEIIIKQEMMSLENGYSTDEARDRFPSNKSDTLSDSEKSLDQIYGSNNHLNSKSPLIQFSRSLSSNSTLDSEKIPKMSMARCSHGVIAYENQLYIIGGYDRGECLDMCEVYDPITNTLTKMKSMTHRRGRAAVSFSEKEKNLYILGGSDGHQELNSLEYYSMVEKRWVCKNFEFEIACSNLATAAFENNIYLVGLRSESRKGIRHTSCLKYEPNSNNFTRLSELNQGRSQGALVCASGVNFDDENPSDKVDRLFIFGGYDQIRCLNSCEMYNIETDSWIPIASMQEPKRGCGAAVHAESNVIYVVGGTNGSQCLKSVEVYNITSKRWTQGPELNVARANVAIAFIGNILFAVGGFDGKSFLRTIEYLNIKNLDAGWSLFHKLGDFTVD